MLCFKKKTNEELYQEALDAREGLIEKHTTKFIKYMERELRGSLSDGNPSVNIEAKAVDYSIRKNIDDDEVRKSILYSAIKYFENEGNWESGSFLTGIGYMIFLDYRNGEW